MGNDALQGLRGEIDRLDNNLAGLIIERLALCRQVAAVKKACGIAVYDSGRESAIIDRITAGLDEETAGYLKAIFTNIMETSKSLQKAGGVQDA